MGRVIPRQDLDGIRWWVAADIAKHLGFSKANEMIRHLPEDEKGYTDYVTLGGTQEMVADNEGGINEIAHKSKKKGCMEYSGAVFL